MAENYVSIAIKATDDGAEADLEALSAKLDELKAKRATMTVDVDDKDGVARIARFDAQIEALSAKVAKPKVSLQGAARAEADMAVLDLQMDKMKEKADAEDAETGGQGLISRMLMGRSGNSKSGGLAGALENIPLIGSQLSKLTEGFGKLGQEGEEAGEEGSSGLADIASSGAALGGVFALLDVAVSALLAEADALATGFIAAGLGVGSFAALAYPSVMKVFGALGDTGAQLKKLSPAIQESVGWIKNLEKQYDQMAASFQRPALDLLNEGLSVANQLLPYLGQFAQKASGALLQLGRSMGNGIDSASFKSFMSYLENISPAAITAIGKGVGELSKDLMKLFSVMDKKDVINAINIAFALLGGTINAITAFIEFNMQAWDEVTGAVHHAKVQLEDARHAFASFGHDVASAFDTARHAAASFGHDIASGFDTARHAVATGAHDIAHYFDDMRHGIASTVGAIGSFIKSHFQEYAAWIGDPIGMAVYTVRTNTHKIAEAFDDMRHGIASAVDDAKHTVESNFDTMRHDIAAVADWIPHAIASAWDAARHTTAAFADWVPHAIETAFDAVRHGISTAFDDVRHVVAEAWDDIEHAFSGGSGNVQHTAESLPGKILGALMSLPGQMMSAGRNIIEGLIRGIESAASAIPGIMKGLASSVESYFTDPLKIFSPSRVFMEHGENVVKGLVLGIQQGTPQAKNAMSHLAGTVAAAPFGTGASGGAGGSNRLELVLTAQGSFLKAMQLAVREVGGDPSMFQKKVAFR
jgi:phage-related protein